MSARRLPAIFALTLAFAAPAAAAPPAAEPAGTRYELLVVGVYRPLDLEGRFVEQPREVYLQSVGVPEGPLTDLIGRALTVVRQAPVPAAVPLIDRAAAPRAPDGGAPDAGVPEPPTMPTPIGRLEVTAVRGEIVIARIVDPEAPADPRVDVPAVMAGDLARYVEPPPPPPPPPPLTADEKAALEAEQRRLERDDARRRSRPGPYERPVMKWKL